MASNQKDNPGLYVVMEGTPINPSPDGKQSRFFGKRETGVSTRTEAPPPSAMSKGQASVMSFSAKSPDNAVNVQPVKPAILSKTGTVGSVPIADRPKPAEKASTLRTPTAGIPLAVSSRIMRTAASSGANTSAFASISESPSNIESDIGFLVHEALEISRQVDESVTKHEGRMSKSKRGKKRGLGALPKPFAGGKLPSRMSTQLDHHKPADAAALYETEQTRLVDSLIFQLKQSAAGVIVTDTDLKIRDVTKQIADSLGIPPEELNPELFSTDVENELTMAKEQAVTTASTADAETQPSASAGGDQIPDISILPTPVEATETSSVQLDPELAAIVETMPEFPLSRGPRGGIGSNLDVGLATQRDQTEADELNEMGQLASLPADVTWADILHVKGRQFKLGNLDELEKGSSTVETGGRLEKLIEQAKLTWPDTIIDGARIDIHKLCQDTQKADGLLPNELQQVAFESHVNRRYNRHPDKNLDDRPAWYQSALQEVRTNISLGDSVTATGAFSKRDQSFGAFRNVAFANVDDALFVPGLETRRRGRNGLQLSDKNIDDMQEGVQGRGMEMPEVANPKFPDFTTGPPLLAFTPLEARKKLFPFFESSADARGTDYLMTRVDERFAPLDARKRSSSLDLFMMGVTKKASNTLNCLISKDDINLLPRFTHRLPVKSSPPHRRGDKMDDDFFARAKMMEAAQQSVLNSHTVVAARQSSAFWKPGKAPMKTRCVSESRLFNMLANSDNSQPCVRIKQDYKEGMAEVALQKELCKKVAGENKEAAEREAVEQAAAGERRAAAGDQDGDEDSEDYDSPVLVEEMLTEGQMAEFDIDGTLLSQIEIVENTRKVMRPSEAELALWSARGGHVRKLGKQLKKRRLNDEKMEWVKQRLAQKSHVSKRSRRLSCPATVAVEYPKRRPHFGTRSSSPDVVLDFEEYARRNGMQPTDNPREWVRDIWNVWFDEVIPPLEAFAQTAKPAADAKAALAESLATLMQSETKVAAVKEETVELIETIEIFDLDLPPVVGTDNDELEQEKVAIMQEEVERLTALLSKPLRLWTKAVALTRRGALLRKLGKLISAKKDLNSALELFPSFVDALWHRHLILLVENQIPAALADLNLIVKIYRFHPRAYMSRGAIYTDREDILEAIDDYTMAIRSTPGNAEAYFLRAKLYEKKGEPLLAMEDYLRANQLMPHDTTALLCHAQHYIRTENWPVAVQDLTQILSREPKNGEIYLMRGKCYTKQNRFEAACADFSATIFYKPDDPEAYFYRGTLLRKLYPDKALSDFSISILLDSTANNIRSLMHRGILYFEMGLDQEAEADFENVVNLDRDNSAAHTNLGRIFLTKRGDYSLAVRRFNTAIKANPTYRQAYLCRAEAQTRLKNYFEALRDFTKAIHLDPSDYSVYVHRGAVVLKTGDQNLAAFCIRQATEAQKEVGQGVYQKAFVQAFLKRFDKAVEILKVSLRSNLSSTQGHIVLGKVYMKAREFAKAAESFSTALTTMRPQREVIALKYPNVTPELYFLLGRCYSNLHKWHDALQAFTDAVKLKPDFAEAFYRRGIARFWLKHQKAIEDIHRALAIDPKIFEAYLTRATFFAQRKLWPLAIANCNEAIKLHPNCIRAFVYRGAFKYFNHNYKGAVDDLTKAIALDPNCVIAQFNRACAYHLADCIKLSLRDYSSIVLVETQRDSSRLTYQTYVNRGLLYFNRRDFGNALADFQHAANMKPNDPLLVHALALCYHKQNLLKRSVLTYSKILATNPSFEDGYVGRTNALVDYNTLPARRYAMKEYTRRLHIDPSLVAARINLAICLQMSGRLHQAYRQLSTVIAMLERDSSSAPLSVARARELRGVVSLQARSFESAFQDLTAAYRIRPSAFILNNRGVCHWMTKNRESAVKDFREALRLDQRFSISYFNLANVYMINNRWEQAKDFFDRALLFDPANETALINRSIALTRLNDLSGAFKDLASASPLSPHAHHIAFNRAVLHRMVKKLPAALSDIELAIRYMPDDPELYKYRATIRGDSGDCEGSLEDYAYAVDLDNFLNDQKAKKDNNNYINKQLVPA